MRLVNVGAGAAMRLIADAVLEICKREELTTRKRYLSAWGEVVPSGKGFVWRWHRSGLPGMLAVLHPCQTVSLSADAAWRQFAAVVRAALK